MYPRRQNTLVVAILVSGLIIAGAIMYTRGNSSETETVDFFAASNTTSLDAVRTVQEDDHIWGSPNAPIVLVTYNDFSCPFCKEYHGTLHDIIDTYGGDGSVAWVFRHIPIVQLHKEAPMYALASECVAREGGNEAFWIFSDALFNSIDIDVKPGTEELLALAEQAGVSRQTFASCMRNNELMGEVEKDFNEAKAAGATASPFTVLLTPDGRTSFTGAREYRPLSAALQAALQTVGATELLPPSSSSNEMLFDFEAAALDTSTVTEESLVPTRE